MKVAEQVYLPQFVFQSVYVTAIRLDKIEEALLIHIHETYYSGTSI